MNEWEYNQVCCLFKVKEAFRAGGISGGDFSKNYFAAGLTFGDGQGGT